MPTDDKSLDPYTAANEEDVATSTKIEEFTEILKSVGSCMLTSVAEDGHIHTRAMAPASKEAPYVFEFIANNVSGKFKEVGRDANVNISVYDKSSSNWISVSGTSSVSNDRERIRELWSPMIAGWFGEIDEKRNGTAEDPRISLIVVKPSEIRYWYRHRTAVGQVVDVLYSAWSGQVETSGSLRTITKEELEAEKARTSKL